MVQQEVKRKTKLYGTVALIFAILLVTFIYTFGSAPVTYPPAEVPLATEMKRFSSYEELRNYLIANTTTTSYNIWARSGVMTDSKSSAAMPEPAPAQLGISESTEGGQYSTTNIQVEGVDEADIVKNDGRYLYVVDSDTRSTIYIVKANPQDPKIITKITLENNTYAEGLYISEDSNRLVVIANRYQPIIFIAPTPEAPVRMPSMVEPNVYVYIYDVADKAYPLLARNFTISGNYFNSRLIGNYVYAVVSQTATVVDDIVTLPQVCETTTATTKISKISPSSVYYADTIPSQFSFTTFIGLNIKNDTEEPANMTLLMGGTSTMYVSLSNIYITYPIWSSDGQYTSIYRVSINGSTLSFKAEGSVAGYVLNQYSMDEYNGYFRLTTTWQKETTLNYVYVLNMNLSKTGELLLPKFEERETIHATRFIGDKCYVVTAEQKDPFFIVDMSNPTAPKVAGQLKIPGFSSYLHPYDENHIIGLGMENSTVKLSLFDVTNVNTPTEIAKYIIQGDWTYSDALHDPHAFLFDKQKQLLVIPVSITRFGYINGTEKTDMLQGGYWQGAYVFKLTHTNGFELKGGVTHKENETNTEYWPSYYAYVNRALYIGNTLYTVSNAKIQLNNIDTLTLIAKVDLSN
ncbi:MAG: beta-propeller domain-containing protein [Candidatus Bathyarchaeia archaeon]